MTVHLIESRILPYPPEVIWKKIRDFNSLPTWHHMIASSSIEAGKNGDQVGAVRNFFTHDGSNIREQLLALNDHRFLIAYNILESGMGVSNYIAEISLQRVTSDNSTFAVWTAQFDCDSEKEKELKQYISETVFQAGLANLNTVLGKG
jgi:Polyketide cyclase / dehydrase and lipid transport